MSFFLCCNRVAHISIIALFCRFPKSSVLWKLVEKKFRQLGEFVEGKENLDIVVHRTFDCGLRAIAIDDNSEEEEDEDDEEEDDVDGPKRKRLKRQRTSSFGDLADEDSIQHNIEELAKEEEAMLNIGLDDDDDNNGDASGDNKNRLSDGNNREGGKNAALEKKKTAVICLDDSEDEAEASQKKNSADKTSDGNGEKNDRANVTSPSTAATEKQSAPTIADSINVIIKSGEYKNCIIDRRARLDNLKLYTVHYTGSSYGLSMVPFAGRVVIKSSANFPNAPPEQNEKPARGDFVVKVGTAVAPFNYPFHGVLNYMKNALSDTRNHGVQVIFGHDPEFSRFFEENVLPAQMQDKEDECKRIEGQLANFAALAPGAAATEAESEATTSATNAPLPAAPPASATAPDVQPEQDDEVIELLED